MTQRLVDGMLTYMETTTRTKTYRVQPLLSVDFRATCFGYVPEAKYEAVDAFEVEAIDPEAACEVVFAICNSYPEEMHIDGRYSDTVFHYRAGKHRSLSVGDVVLVKEPEAAGEGWRFACASFGWKAIA